MTNEELALIFGVVGGILTLLFGVISYFLHGVLTEAKEVRVDVQKILVIMGIATKEIETAKTDINFMKIKQQDNEQSWTELYQKYDLKLKK